MSATKQLSRHLGLATRSARYVFAVQTQMQGLQPEDVAEALPELNFIRAPYPDENLAIWLFETQEDADLFAHENSQYLYPETSE